MLCEKGAIAENLKSLSHYVAEADTQGVDIIGFPEMSITGYADPTKYPEAIIRLDGAEIATILDMINGRNLTILARLIEENPRYKPFITQAVIRDGQLIGSYCKHTIEDEEAEWFSAGEQFSVFTHDDLTFGIAICADIGNEHVFAECARQGAQMVFELAAPGLNGEQATRNWRSGFEWLEHTCQEHLSGYTRKYGIWIVVATKAGRTVDEEFPGVDMCLPLMVNNCMPYRIGVLDLYIWRWTLRHTRLSGYENW